MSDTPPMKNDMPLNGRDRTPELTSKREKRTRDDEDDDRSRSDRRRHEDDERPRDRDRERERERERDVRERGSRDGDSDRDRERERRHRRHRDGDRDEGDDERRGERRRRHHHEDETEEERDERRKRRREREERHRDRTGADRDRSRESHRSHHREREPRSDRGSREPRSERGGGRERDDGDAAAYREMTREEKEREREKRDREMQDERREAARQREERYGQMDRDRDADRRRFRDDRPPPPGPPIDSRGSLPPRPPMSPPPPRRRRDSPNYDGPPRQRGGPRGSPPPPPPPKDPVVQLLEEVDKEQRSVFVSQIASRLTSQDLGDFFAEMLGPKAVRDARVVSDKVSRRSKGIGYVELDSVEDLNKALSLSGTIVMGIPISIKQTESERNREGQMEAAMAKLQSGEWEREEKQREQRERQRPQRQYLPKFPPLSTGLQLPPGLDVDAHKHASIPYHRLFITSLAYSLTPDDVSQVFEAFGPIEFVDLHRDHHGQSKGTAYVQFQGVSAAQMALDAMDNFELAGRTIRVSAVEDRSQAKDIIEDTSFAPKMDHNARRDLMQKLARTETPAAPAPRPPPVSREPARPTPFLLVGNMFNPDEETERNWDLDMAEDIKGEVETKYGPVRNIKVDKMSRGDVYIEFDGVVSSERAQKGLGGRFFGGRQLTAAYITEGIMKAHM